MKFARLALCCMAGVIGGTLAMSAAASKSRPEDKSSQEHQKAGAQAKTDTADLNKTKEAGTETTLYAYRNGAVFATLTLSEEKLEHTSLAKMAAKSGWKTEEGVSARPKCREPKPSPPNCVICKDGTVICKGPKR